MGIMNHGGIQPSPCPVYDQQPLLYLFYGRPAYKPAQGIGGSGIVDLAPICLVFDPDLLEFATRIVPFDSGGFKRYFDVIGPGLPRSEFELSGDPTFALRLVSAFFQTNRGYYEHLPKLDENAIPFADRSARAYARLLAHKAIGDTDDRIGTIECQFTGDIPLAGALKAIVAPAAMLDDAEVRHALALCPDAKQFSYKTYGRSAPLSFAHTIYERIDTYLEAEGCFA